MFLSRRETAFKSKRNTESYTYDLYKTLSLNLDIIQNTMKLNSNNKTKKQSKILKKLKEIDELITTKKDLIEKKKQLQVKILLDSQIKEEHKRSQMENEILEKDILTNNFENFQKKQLILKKCLKKFSQIETVVKKESLNNKKWAKSLTEFEFEGFLYENCNFKQKKNITSNEIDKIRKDIKLIKQENNRYEQKEKKTMEERHLRLQSNNYFSQRMKSLEHYKNYFTFFYKKLSEKPEINFFNKSYVNLDSFGKYTNNEITFQNYETENNLNNKSKKEEINNKRKKGNEIDKIYDNELDDDNQIVNISHLSNLNIEDISKIEGYPKKNVVNMSFLNFSWIDKLEEE